MVKPWTNMHMTPMSVSSVEPPTWLDEITRDSTALNVAHS